MSPRLGARFARRVAAARAYLGAGSTLRSLIGTQSAALIFFFCAIPVEVAYATSTLHSGDLGYGALLATWGAGLVAGSLVFTRAGRSLWTMLIGGTLAVGCAYLGLSAAPSIAVACLAALPGGFGNGVQWAAFLGLVQELTPRRLLGRMMGVAEGAASVAQVLGYSLGGAIALASPRLALLTAGSAACVLTLFFVRAATLGRTMHEVAVGPDSPAEQESSVRSVAP